MRGESQKRGERTGTKTDVIGEGHKVEIGLKKRQKKDREVERGLKKRQIWEEKDREVERRRKE